MFRIQIIQVRIRKDNFQNKNLWELYVGVTDFEVNSPRSAHILKFPNSVYVTVGLLICTSHQIISGQGTLYVGEEDKRIEDSGAKT